MLRRLFASMSVVATFLSAAPTMAASIVIGSPTAVVPAYLSASSLGADEFLLPILAKGAGGLQDWSFTFSFDPAVVEQIDPFFSFYGGAYPALFDSNDPGSLSAITAAGALNAPSQLIAGFSSGATGDGTLLFLAFHWLNTAGNPVFTVSDVTVTESRLVPEPNAFALACAALFALLVMIHRKTPEAVEAGVSPFTARNC